MYPLPQSVGGRSGELLATAAREYVESSIGQSLQLQIEEWLATREGEPLGQAFTLRRLQLDRSDPHRGL